MTVTVQLSLGALLILLAVALFAVAGLGFRGKRFHPEWFAFACLVAGWALLR